MGDFPVILFSFSSQKQPTATHFPLQFAIIVCIFVFFIPPGDWAHLLFNLTMRFDPIEKIVFVLRFDGHWFAWWLRTGNLAIFHQCKVDGGTMRKLIKLIFFDSSATVILLINTYEGFRVAISNRGSIWLANSRRIFARNVSLNRVHFTRVPARQLSNF